MAKLTPEMIKVIETMGVYPIATATPDGVPNLVYIGCLKVVDAETIMIADNKFFKTRQNLDANSVLAVTFWHPDAEGCYQVKGRTELVEAGDLFADCKNWVEDMTGGSISPKAAVLLHVDEIYSGAEQLA